MDGGEKVDNMVDIHVGNYVLLQYTEQVSGPLSRSYDYRGHIYHHD